MSVCKFYSLIFPHSVKSENTFKTAGQTTLQLLICVLVCSHLLWCFLPWLLLSYCLVLSPPGPSSHFILLSFPFCVLFSTCFWNMKRMPTSVPAALSKDGVRVVAAWWAGVGSARKPCVPLPAHACYLTSLFRNERTAFKLANILDMPPWVPPAENSYVLGEDE